MALLPIKIPAGFYRNATQYQAKGRWFKGNLVRFSEGRLRPIGGWMRLADTQILKKGSLRDLTIKTAGTGYSAGTLSATGGGGSGFAGTYTVSGTGAILTTTITNQGTGYTTVPTVVISHAGNSNAVIIARVFNSTDPIRGLHSWRLSTGARYLAVGSTQSLRIWDGSQSAGTNAPIYDITPAVGAVPSGNINFIHQEDFVIAGLGYGALSYGGDLGGTNFDGSTGTVNGGDVYGIPRYPAEDPDVTDPDAFRDNFAPVWSLDNFGDDLLACHSGEGTIWHWAIATGGPSGGAVQFNNANQTATAPVILANAPISNVAVLVTPERHIMCLGAGGNQRRIQWGHQEGLTGTATWNPSLTNTAGDLDLQTKGRIIGGFKTRYGVLIFTTSDVWKTNYLGPPYVYGVERLTEGGGPVGMKSIAGSADFVAWMSRGRFWSFTGGYVQELSCDVADFVFADINLDVEGLISAGHNAEFGEIIWFYPKEGDEFNTRYVTYSYREKHWTTGELQRSALEPSDALGYPVWAGADGYLYRHEMDPDTQSTPIQRESTVVAPTTVTGLSGLQSRVVAKGVDAELHPNVSTEDHLCFAESGSIEIGSGNQIMSVKQILTDTDAATNGLRMKISVKQTPDGASIEKGPYPLESDGYTDTRFVGREAVLRVESPFDQEWRFGEVRLDATASGSR
tara:strand:+ start:1076 stop:3118 length:2043 start_codon:yes stop_codon:yes gene_type:complete